MGGVQEGADIMSKQQYQEHRFKASSLRLIEVMERIINDYVAQGYRLTARQLYYQLVALGVIENSMKSYKNTIGILSDAKLAGLLDWDAIEDRTREFLRRSRWSSASAVVRSAANSFHMDMWAGQAERVFCIVEKEALAGVLNRVCKRYDVPLLAARGYPSGTVLREFCIEDILPWIDEGQSIHILHLGDHDPSGIDMTRDLTERIDLFSEFENTHAITLTRIALTMDQVNEVKPPPNPAKHTDARFQSYKKRYGSQCWELDALKPEYLDALVSEHVKDHIDNDKWTEREDEIEEKRKAIIKVADKFEKDNA